MQIDGYSIMHRQEREYKQVAPIQLVGQFIFLQYYSTSLYMILWITFSLQLHDFRFYLITGMV